MVQSLALIDSALQAAGEHLVQASAVMSETTALAPIDDLRSITGIGSSVSRYLRGLAVARAALADAARTGSEAVARLMADSAELDRNIADGLGVGFAMAGELG